MKASQWFTVSTTLLFYHYLYQGATCSKYCLQVAGICNILSSSTMFTLAFSIINYLLTLVISNIISADNRIRRWVHPWRWREVKIEVLVTIPPLLVSFVLAWVPYIKQSYGLSGPFCWVQSTRYDENCTKSVDLTSQMIYYGLYKLVGIISVVLCVVFLAMYCKMRRSYQFEKARKLLRKALILMTFQIIYVVTVYLFSYLQDSTQRLLEHPKSNLFSYGSLQEWFVCHN